MSAHSLNELASSCFLARTVDLLSSPMSSSNVILSNVIYHAFQHQLCASLFVAIPASMEIPVHYLY